MIVFALVSSAGVPVIGFPQYRHVRHSMQDSVSHRWMGWGAGSSRMVEACPMWQGHCGFRQLERWGFPVQREQHRAMSRFGGVRGMMLSLVRASPRKSGRGM
jgi:hypothetical protein